MTRRPPGPAPATAVVSAMASGAGKTLWVEALTREFAARRLRVGVVKHHPHGTAGDRDDSKDTARAARAGATSRVLAEPGAMHLYWRTERSAAALLADGVRLLSATTAPDVVLAEGFRDVPCRIRLWVGPGAPAVADGLCLHVEAAGHADPAQVAAIADRILEAPR